MKRKEIDAIKTDPEPTTLEAEAAAELRRLHAYCQELESHLILDCMTHVQTPAENEHVAGDVSKNGADLNMSTQQPAPATQQAGEVVAYLDIGAGGYLDLGSALSDEALQQLPKGRHALVIAGTYGIDGYVAAPQPSPAAQGDALDAARLDWLTFNLSGKALRDIGVVWSEHGDARRAIDAARAAQEGK